MVNAGTPRHLARPTRTVLGNGLRQRRGERCTMTKVIRERCPPIPSRRTMVRSPA